MWADLEDDKRNSHGKNYQIIPDRRNGKRKRSEPRIIVLGQRNGKEVWFRVSPKYGGAMAAGGGVWFGSHQKYQYLMI